MKAGTERRHGEGRRTKSASAATAVKKPGKRGIYMVCALLAALLIISAAMVLRSASERKAYTNYMEQAERSFSESDFDSALAALRKAAAIDKTDECLMLMADCYETQGNYSKALEILRMMDVQDTKVSARISSIEGRRQTLSEAEKVTIAGKQYPSAATGLVLDNMGLTSGVFTEIVQLFSLESLSLAGNSVSDIGQISQLGGLVTLNLSDNQISDISPLSALGSLRTLYLDNNPIGDLTPLCSLVNLTNLSIKGIGITEAELETLSKALPSCAIHSEAAQEESQEISFGGLTFKSDVTELNLSNMGLRDISALSSCQSLTSIDLSNNEISDLSPLMNIPALQWLDVSNNELSDLRPLMGISTLRFLNASGNSIFSTTPLTMMTGLSELYLDQNPIKDFSGLRKLRSTGTLGLSATGLTDDALQYLAVLTNLHSLGLEDNPALTGEAVDALQMELATCTILRSELSYSVDIGGHTVKSDVTELDLGGAGITDITGIASLPKLVNVKLNMNGISNIYILEYSESRLSIKTLDLSSNALEDITALSCLQSVEELNLANNLISSELPLMNLRTLKKLWLGGNPLTPEQIMNIQNALPDCQIIMD